MIIFFIGLGTPHFMCMGYTLVYIYMEEGFVSKHSFSPFFFFLHLVVTQSIHERERERELSQKKKGTTKKTGPHIKVVWNKLDR